MVREVIVSWSSGKDSAMLLERLLRSPAYDVKALFTTVTADYDRVSIHGVRSDVLAAQAASLGLPVHTASIPRAASNEIYEAAFVAGLSELSRIYPGCCTIAFGDLFLTDVKDYRERLLSKTNWQGVYPLWGENTADLAEGFVKAGYRALFCCVDTEQLDGRFAGEDFDSTAISSFPAGVDPCGENGEFHTLVYGGPIFREELRLERGEKVLRENRFQYCDVTLGDSI